MQRNFMWYLAKLDRIAAWTLFISVILLVLSGYGMTKNLINYDLALKIHNQLLPVIMGIAFTVHGSFAISLAFKRWKIWNSLTRYLLFGFMTIFLVIIAWYSVQDKLKLRQSGTKITTDTVQGSSSQNSTNSISSNPAATSKEKIFTMGELAKYNGKNDLPAYVAVDGVVYDMSSVFRNGNHAGRSAGQDLSAEFHTQHSENLLSRVERVGVLQ